MPCTEPNVDKMTAQRLSRDPNSEKSWISLSVGEVTPSHYDELTLD